MEKSKNPKVFISYSWSSQEHQLLVKEWADRLSSDGIEIILDIYDLKEGQDVFAFMEKMVTDTNVTNVLVICDKVYAEKADKRHAGVGAETQIISKEVYEKVDQTKFIPIAIDFDDNGKAVLPVFLKGRRWIDFSSAEAVNSNWEQLVRVIFGKPLYQKPAIGKPPIYVQVDAPIPVNPISTKYSAFKSALTQNKVAVKIYRRDFLSACCDVIDSLRTRREPGQEKIGEKILDTFEKLLPVRNYIIDWVLLDAEAGGEDFSEALIDLLENLIELKSRPNGVNSYSGYWFEAHELFVYELFLYIVAALLRVSRFDCLNTIFKTQYLLPEVEARGQNRFSDFSIFWTYAEGLHQVMKTSEGGLYISAASELFRRKAERIDILFKDIMQAELLVLLMAFIMPKIIWYPQTYLYAKDPYDFPFFLRASQKRGFDKLSKITGISDANELRKIE